MVPGPGKRGWLAVLGIVAIAEFDDMTLSDAFGNAAKHPVGRYVLIPAWAVLTAHLFDMLPPKYDPLYHVGQHTYARRRRVT